MFNHHRLHCYAKALFVARSVPTVAKGWPYGSAYLQDQLKRAVSSVVLNIAEGNERQSKADRNRFFAMARASAAESSAILDIAEAYGWISSSTHHNLSSELHQVVKMVTAIMHPKS